LLVKRDTPRLKSYSYPLPLVPL